MSGRARRIERGAWVTQMPRRRLRRQRKTEMIDGVVELRRHVVLNGQFSIDDGKLGLHEEKALHHMAYAHRVQDGPQSVI